MKNESMRNSGWTWKFGTGRQGWNGNHGRPTSPQGSRRTAIIHTEDEQQQPRQWVGKRRFMIWLQSSLHSYSCPRIWTMVPSFQHWYNRRQTLTNHSCHGLGLHWQAYISPRVKGCHVGTRKNGSALLGWSLKQPSLFRTAYTIGHLQWFTLGQQKRVNPLWAALNSRVRHSHACTDFSSPNSEIEIFWPESISPGRSKLLSLWLSLFFLPRAFLVVPGNTSRFSLSLERTVGIIHALFCFFIVFFPLLLVSFPFYFILFYFAFIFTLFSLVIVILILIFNYSSLPPLYRG